MRHVVLVSFLAIGLVACGGGGGTPPGDDQPDAATGDDTPDADNAGWESLVSRTWTVPQGVLDIYRCTRIRLDHDVFIQGFRSLSPLGSHHAVLTWNSTMTGPLGDYDCNVMALDGYKMVYASGVGTDDLIFPDGVGVVLTAGTYLNLNLHLFNAGDVEINGESGVLIKTLPAAPAIRADMTFAGDMSLTIPAHSTGHVEEGGCAADRDYTVVALWPHMHQYAVHTKFEHQGTVLLDQPFSFSDQRNWLQSPALEVHQGDMINVTCTYDNPTNADIHWGDSSTAEMCFTGMYRYPAGGSLFGCVTGGF